MAEEFAFEQILGDGGAIHFNEGFVMARAVVVEEAGEEFLAGTSLTENKNATTGTGDLAALFQQLDHGRIGGNDVMSRWGFGARWMGGGVPEDAVNSLAKLRFGNGFGDVIGDAEPSRFDGGCLVAVAGDNDDRGLATAAAEASDQPEAVEFFHDECRHEKIDTAGANDPGGSFRTRARGDVVLGAEHARDGAKIIRDVVRHENSGAARSHGWVVGATTKIVKWTTWGRLSPLK